MARGSADRYFQQEVKDTLKLVPEGIEGQVPYKGPVDGVLHQLVGGLRPAWATSARPTSTSCASAPGSSAFRRRRVSESHPHGVGDHARGAQLSSATSEQADRQRAAAAGSP